MAHSTCVYEEESKIKRAGGEVPSKPVLHIGERNETLFKEACHLRDLGLDRDRVEHLYTSSESV